jgi:CheY-like chemotaxis protein
VDESDSVSSAQARLDENRTPYDLVLVDARLSAAADGLALAGRIQRDVLAPKVLVMLTTDSPAEAARCRQLGLAYLLKPVRRPALRDAIENRGDREPEPANDAIRRPLRILLADDSEDNRFLIRGFLRHTGYLLTEVEDGARAIEEFKRGTYDLVLTDVEMPGIDGYTAARGMRTWEGQTGRAKTPILALTAHALPDAKARSIDAGCTAHLTKPIRKATLLEAIQRHAGVAREDEPAAPDVEPWLRPLIAGYLEKRRSDVPNLRAFVETQDFAAIRTLGHQMAGTGESFGFPAITEIGLVLEDAARSSDTSAIQSAIERLDAFLRSIEAG